MKALEVPPLGLTDRDAEEEFERLQARLIPLWQSIRGLDRTALEPQTVVVVPSQTVDFDCQGAEMQAYEERFLFFLLLLRQPRTRGPARRADAASLARRVPGAGAAPRSGEGRARDDRSGYAREHDPLGAAGEREDHARPADRGGG